MHKSLRPSSNLILIAVCAAIVVAAIIIPAQPSRMLVLAVGGLLGSIAGSLQIQAMKREKDRFLAATTALEVRGAMTASKVGQYSIYLLWGSGAVLLLCALYQKEGLFFRWIAGYAAFALVRDSIALKGCIMLHHAAESRNRG